LKVPRILPYLVVLIVLAFALGSLTRGTPGGSLLFRSYWLLYLVYLGPVVILGALVAVIILIGLHYRDIGAAIGFGMAQRRRMRKRGSRYTIFVQILFWALALGVLIETKGSIFNPTHATNSNITKTITGENSMPPNPFQAGDFLPTLSNLVQNSWFSLAFLGLLIVGGLILIESYSVSLKETHDLRIQELPSNREQGLQAVHEAIKLVEDPASDPRSRIIASYQHLVATVSRLGVPVSSDLTARELDRAVRSIFALKGPATTYLTQLFEEARYSLHEIRDSDADKAREYLESVAEELKIQLETET
jgi:Domain of unknown function (DUF4129)